jgi:hypothetical protein
LLRKLGIATNGAAWHLLDEVKKDSASDGHHLKPCFFNRIRVQATPWVQFERCCAGDVLGQKDPLVMHESKPVARHDSEPVSTLLV